MQSLTRALCLGDNLYSVIVCIANCELIRKSRQWKLVLGSRVMAHGMNAVMSEVPMPLFTATLRNLHSPPDVTAPEATCVLKMLCCVHVASCFTVVC